MVKYLPAGTICWSELGLADWLAGSKFPWRRSGAGRPSQIIFQLFDNSNIRFNYWAAGCPCPGLALNKYIDINIKIWSPDWTVYTARLQPPVSFHNFNKRKWIHTYTFHSGIISKSEYIWERCFRFPSNISPFTLLSIQKANLECNFKLSLVS